MKISAVIVCFNEINELKRCLHSIHNWADEIVVIDIGDLLETKEICKQYNARVVSHPFVPYVERIRNFSIQQCSGEWILILDPDEWLTPSLKKFLKQHTKTSPYNIVNIPRMNIFFGKWIQHTNFWPDRQIRFFRANTVIWKDQLHSYPQTLETSVSLPAVWSLAIRHCTYPSFESLIEKQERYSSVRSQERFDLGEKAQIKTLLFSLSREFLARYIKHLGFLDMKEGVLLMVGLFYFSCATEWKLWKLQQKYKNSLPCQEIKSE